MCVLGSAAVLETQRDLEGLEGPSRITSSAKRARFVRIPTHSGQAYRFDAGHRSEMKPATVPK
jgi:hypothetical protein